MALTLNPLEQTVLVEVLEDSLMTLRGEISHTDSRQFKARLREREQVLEQIVGRLRGIDMTVGLESGRRGA